MITQLLAETAATAGGEMNNITTNAIQAIGWVIVAVSSYAVGKTRRSVTIEKQPVEIALQKDYVTRTEFSDFKGEMRTEIKGLEMLYRQLVQLINERDEKLTTKIADQGAQMTEMINRVASGAYEARRRIHETVNDLGNRMAVSESKGDISKGLASLGSAVMKALKSNETKH